MKTKKFFLGMLAVTGMLFATSCQQEEPIVAPVDGEYVNATFTLGAADAMGTRATIGMGLSVDKVACAVYDANGEEMKILRQYVDVQDGDPRTATYNVRLAKGQDYRVAFFAYNSGGGHYDVTDLKNITIKTPAYSNVETRDAFTNYVDIKGEELTNKGNIEQTVFLKRPFAQLNLGIDKTEFDDAANSGVKVVGSKITVSNVYNAFSAFDNTVAEGATPVSMTFDMNAIPTEALTVNNVDYHYLALNYLLVGDMSQEKSLTDVEFMWLAEDGKTNNPTTHFINIPVQRNFRTNILGKLLTTPAEFNIIIDADFEEPDYVVDTPWDGVSENEPAKDADGTYIVKTAAELVWMANQPTTDRNGDPYFRNIKLGSDIDLNGNEIGAITFKGTFDGQGHTISNMVLVSYDGSSVGASLFGERTMGTIKNLNVKNAKANVVANADGWAAAILAGITDMGEVTLDNVHVYNSDIKGVMGVGGLVGAHLAGNVKLTLNNCSVNDTKLGNNLAEDKTENGHVAGLVGRVTGTLTIGENVSLNNVDVTGYYSAKRQEGSIDAVAAKDLRNNLGTINGYDNVTSNNVTVSKIPTTAAAGNATIASANGMFAFANSVNAGGNNYSGKTVTLTADIDLENEVWTPVGQTGGYSSATYFCGTFEGNNKTISNLNVTHWEAGKDGGKNYASGLFGFIDAAAQDKVVVKDLTIDGAKVAGHHWVGTIVGYLTGEVVNCKVNYAQVECTHANDEACGDKAGVVVGQINGTQGKVTNCHAELSTVKAGRDAGQVVGAGKTSQVIDCTATDVTVTATGDCTGANIRNEIVGREL